MKTIELAHSLWETHLSSLKKEYFCMVDATCGNGHDSLFLSSFPGSLHCIDIQQQAIENTKTLLKDKAASFHLRSHVDLSFIQTPIDLIVYNLGYLPGSDKKIITKASTTISSLESALAHLAKGGMISIMIYTGHLGGKEEKKQIMNFLKTIAPSFHIYHITSPNKNNCPEILLIS